MIDAIVVLIGILFGIVFIISARSNYYYLTVIKKQKKIITLQSESIENLEKINGGLEETIKNAHDIITIYSGKYVSALKDLLACYKKVNMVSEIKYVEELIIAEQHIKEMSIDTINITDNSKKDETNL